MEKFIKTVTFNAVINGKEYKGIELDFRLAERFGATLTLKTDMYTYSGVCCLAEVDGMLIDFNIYLDEEDRPAIKNLKIGAQLRLPDPDNQDEYTTTEGIKDFSYSDIRIKYINPKCIVRQRDICINKITKEKNKDFEPICLLEHEIFADDEHEACFFFADGQAVSLDGLIYMTYPRKRDLTNEQKEYISVYCYGEEYEYLNVGIDYRQIALAYGEAKYITIF